MVVNGATHELVIHLKRDTEAEVAANGSPVTTLQESSVTNSPAARGRTFLFGDATPALAWGLDDAPDESQVTIEFLELRLLPKVPVASR